MQTTGKFGLGAVLLLALLLSSCGYYFPHVYEGPAHVIYMPSWQNRTSKLGLDNKIYQSVTRWFQKSEAIDLTKDKAQADMILAGEIITIDLPSVSWDGVSNSTGNKVKLFVRYVLKDLKSGAILWEVPRKLYTSDYTDKQTSEDEALLEIIDEMSEDIYLGTLEKIRNLHKADQAKK